MKKVGLALGAGSARGLAHIGVLKILLEEKIPVDFIAGTSAGSIVGGMLAAGKTIDEMKMQAYKAARKRFALFADPTIPRMGLVKGKRIQETLNEIYGKISFNDLKIPFCCIATDIDTGQPVIMREGLVADAVLASCTIPVMLTAVKKDERFLVDGMLVDPVPVNIVRAMGADVVIAVNVMPVIIRPLELDKSPNVLKVLMQTLHITSFQLIKSSLAGADIVIEPQVNHIGYFDFHRVDECISLGEEACRNVVSRIKSLIAGP